MEEQIKIIESLLHELLEKINISEYELEILKSQELPQFIIRTKEAGILIGEGGQHLLSLSYLLRKMADRKFEEMGVERILFFLDVNDYQAKKIRELKNLAKMTAQRVKYFKKEIELEPMPAYERRIIHSALTDDPDIVTESRGEEPNRRVVIKMQAEAF